MPRRPLALALVAAGVLTFLVSAPAHAQWPDLSSSEPAGGGDKDAALVIGVEDYVFAPDVPGAVQNATDWYTWLTRGRGVPATRVVLLRDKEATREGIKKHAAAVASQVQEGGTLWVIYVGHGAPGPRGEDGVLVGVDAQQSADGLYARSLPQRELLGLLGAGAQSDTVLVLDACFSGRTGAGEPIAPGLQPLIAVQAPSELPGNATVLTAGASDQFAGPLPGVDRPAFSYLVLGALRGWGDADGDGAVTAAEAVGYARDALQVVVKDRSQRPEITGADPKLVLATGVNDPAPDLAAIVVGDSGSSPPAGGGGAAIKRDREPPTPAPSGLPQAINLGFSNGGFLQYQLPLGTHWAAMAGVGGWLLDFSDEYLDGVSDVETSTLSLSASLGLRWLWQGDADSPFVGFNGSYFFSSPEDCDTIVGTGDDRQCTERVSFSVIGLTANIGKRWTFADTWNVTARIGGGILTGFNVIEHAQLTPDVELSAGYDF